MKTNKNQQTKTDRNGQKGTKTERNRQKQKQQD